MHGGEPQIAWGEYLRKPYGSRLTVRTWDGKTSWVRGPAFNDIKAFSRTPALALDAKGQPTVAWLQGEVLASNVYASRWTGTGWQALGASLNRHPQSYVASTRLVLDNAGQPIVAWLEDLKGQDTLYASRWTGQRLAGARRPGQPALRLGPQPGAQSRRSAAAGLGGRKRRPRPGPAGPLDRRGLAGLRRAKPRRPQGRPLARRGGGAFRRGGAGLARGRERDLSGAAAPIWAVTVEL